MTTELDHADHGRGDEDGPFDSDCPCRAGEWEHECALAGCGFCRAAVIYRCGWCGTPVNSNGGLLDEETRIKYPYPDEYLAAHAHAKVRYINGFCCPFGDGSFYQEECPDATPQE